MHTGVMLTKYTVRYLFKANEFNINTPGKFHRERERESLTFITLLVSEKIAVLKFLPHMDTQLAGRPNTDHNVLTFFMCVKNLTQTCSHLLYLALILEYSTTWHEQPLQKKITCLLGPVFQNLTK